MLEALQDEPNVIFRLTNNQRDGLSALYDGTDWNSAIFDIKLPLSDFSGLYKRGDELSALTINDGGLLLAAAFQEQFPGRPMLIWTGFLRAAADQLEPLVRSGLCMVIEKGFETTSIDDAKQFLFKNPKKKRFDEIAWDAVLCQPNLGGVGFDFKKFLKNLKKKLQRDQ
jgi:hypothetical protein